MRDLYHDKSVVDKGLGYTIVRPGGLTSDPIHTWSISLEVNQGDDKSGRLSHADVAGICIACLENESTFDSTFECYQTNTAKPVENVGLSNILKQTDPTSYKSGQEQASLYCFVYWHYYYYPPIYNSLFLILICLGSNN